MIFKIFIFLFEIILSTQNLERDILNDSICLEEDALDDIRYLFEQQEIVNSENASGNSGKNSEHHCSSHDISCVAIEEKINCQMRCIEYLFKTDLENSHFWQLYKNLIFELLQNTFDILKNCTLSKEILIFLENFEIFMNIVAQNQVYDEEKHVIIQTNYLKLKKESEYLKSMNVFAE